MPVACLGCFGTPDSVIRGRRPRRPHDVRIFLLLAPDSGEFTHRPHTHFGASVALADRGDVHGLAGEVSGAMFVVAMETGDS